MLVMIRMMISLSRMRRRVGGGEGRRSGGGWEEKGRRRGGGGESVSTYDLDPSALDQFALPE